MRIAAHGMISDTGVSSAGSYPKLLRVLLEQGHEIDFYGYRRFTEPKSLESLPGYRFRPFTVGWSRRVKLWLNEHPNRYAEVLRSTLAHIAFQREAVRAMEASGVPYDFALCLDVPNLWKSRFPMLSWPQGPPHTEWSALRKPEIARSMIEGDGHIHYAAVQVFYAARWVQGKVALDHSDLFMVASPWARDRWVDFGVDPDRVKLAPYPIELGSLEQVPPAATDGEVTFLWLGRSVPRKRLDLFMAAFELLRKRRPGVRARFVGQVDQDPYARRMLIAYENDPGFSVCAHVSRSEVPALFASSHVLVQPSENENFGFSLAEALAAGRPIVAGPSNGTAAFGGDALFSFARYEAASVAEAMERAADAIARDPLAIGDAARRAARKHFDPQSVAANVLELGRLAAELRAGDSRRKSA